MGEHPLRHDTLRRSLARSRAIGEETGDRGFAALPEAVAATGRFDRGEFRQAAAALAEAVPALEDAGSLTDASYFSGLAAVAHGRLGDFAAAEPWLERCDRLAADSGDATAVLDADLFRAMVEVERGNLDRAIALATRGVEAAERIGNHLCALAGSHTIGEGYLLRGAPADAIPPLERSSELAGYCNAGATAVLARARLTGARARVGIADGVVPRLGAALAEAAALGDAFGEAEILRERAAARALDADVDWAAVAADYEGAIARFESLGTRPSLARALEEYGVALEARGDAAGAREPLARAAALIAGLRPAGATADGA
jgi:tetratricopeptide (TPR) repeat protein